MKRRKQLQKEKIATIIFYTGLIVLPFFLFCYIISLHSTILIKDKLSGILPVLFVFFSFVWTFSFLYRMKIHEKERKKIYGDTLLIVGTVFLLLGVLGFVYDENSKFKSWIIQTANDTFYHKYLATWFYSPLEMKSHLTEENTSIDIEKIEFDTSVVEQEFYENEYEKQILTKEKGNDLYKVIPIKGTTLYENHPYKGYLVAIYDPSKVKVATSSGAGTSKKSYGEFLQVIASREKAVVAINAGGFYDPNWDSNGGIPHGLVISSGVVKTDFRRAIGSGGIIGFNDKNQLVLRRMSKDEAVASKIRDAVDFGPYLILDGVNQFKNERGWWGYQPRTAIGQRKDGIVLFLIIDGRLPDTVGADMDDLAKIMEDYGAYNAANLDGGTSSTLIVKNKIVNQPNNGYDPLTIRKLPNAFIVVE